MRAIRITNGTSAGQFFIGFKSDHYGKVGLVLSGHQLSFFSGDEDPELGLALSDLKELGHEVEVVTLQEVS